jgi:hypothetical protein
LLDRLGPLALEVRPGPPVDGTLLNAAFLVAEDRLEEFRAAVDEISDRESERLRLRVAGPLPPYSFVDPAAETSPSGAGPRRRRARLDGASDLDGARSRSRGGTR